MYIHLTLVPYIGHAGRAEDQADPALGQRAAAHRHPARHAAVPLRERAQRRHPQEDRAVRVAAPRGGRLGQGRRQHLQGAAVVRPRGRRRLHPRPLRRSRPRRPTSTSGARSCDRADAATETVRIALVGKYVAARGRLPVGLRGAAPRRLPARRADRDRLGRLRRALDSDEEALERWATPTASSSPAASAARGIEGKIRAVPRRPRAARSRTSASAWACTSRSASSPATSPAWPAPTRPSSTSRPSAR